MLLFITAVPITKGDEKGGREREGGREGARVWKGRVEEGGAKKDQIMRLSDGQVCVGACPPKINSDARYA